MPTDYKVVPFLPDASGVVTKFLRIDRGWDGQRCAQFEAFLNKHAKDGWQLHSSDLRESIIAKRRGASKGLLLVCVFARIQPTADV